MEVRLQDIPNLIAATTAQSTPRERERARGEALRGLVSVYLAGELYPRAVAYDINELISRAGMVDGAAGREQTISQVRAFLAEMTLPQLRALLLEVQAESSLQLLLREAIDAKQNLIPTWGAPAPAPAPAEPPGVRVVPPAPSADTAEVAPRTAPADTTFRGDVSIEAEAQRAASFLLDGGDAATLTDIFYGASKADQTALARRIGELLIARAGAAGERLPINPERAFTTVMERRLSDGERRLFTALRENPDSRYALHDDIFRSVRGWGTHMPGLVEAFSRLTMTEQTALAEAYQRRYGESLPDRLFSGWAEVGDANDRARLYMLQNQERLGDGDLAYAIYAQSAGRRGVDHAALFQALEAAAGRFGNIDNLYARSLPGQEMLRDVMTKLSGSRESPHWYQRLTALTEGRWDAYLAATGQLYLAGAVDTQEMVRVLERYGGQGGISSDQMQAAFASLGGSGNLAEQLRARDPQLGGVLAGPLNGELASLALELRQALQGRGTERGRPVSELLARVPPDQRAAFAETYARVNGVSLEEAIRSGFIERPAVRGMPNTAELRWRERLLREVRDGPLSAIDMFDAFERQSATAEEVLAAIARTPLDQRSGLAAQYDSSRGEGAFQRLLDSMEAPQRRSVQLQLGLGADDVRALWEGQRRPDGTWDGASRYLMDRFGFTGDFLDTAVRDFFIESQALSRRIEQDGEVSVGELARYRRAYERMVQRFGEYDGEKRELAQSLSNSAAAIAGVTVALASGGSLSPLLLLAGAGAAGTTSAVTTAAVLGSDATPEELARAAFTGAAFEAGGQLVAGSVIRVGGRLVRIVGGASAEPVAGLVSATTRDQVALADAVSRLARTSYWHADDVAPMLANLGQLSRRDATLVRDVSRRLDAGEVVGRDELARVQQILQTLSRAPRRETGAALTATDIANMPELLAGRTPGELQQMMRLEGSPWRVSYQEPWSYDDAATGLRLSWDEGRWTVRTPNGATRTIDPVAPPAFRPSGQVPPQYETLVRDSGLPVIDGGQLATHGSRTAYQTFDTQLAGYARFTMPDGRRVFSMAPIDGTVSDALAAIRAFEARTGRTDIMARPLGIHFFNGQPRLIFEDLGATRVARLGDLPADEQAVMRSLLTDPAFQQVEARGFDSFGGRYFESDYIFLSDGRVRLGLPVRSRLFGAHVDELFRSPGG